LDLMISEVFSNLNDSVKSG